MGRWLHARGHDDPVREAEKLEASPTPEQQPTLSGGPTNVSQTNAHRAASPVHVHIQE